MPDNDSDSDGVPDCQDLCPLNGTKMSPDACGCATTDLGDSDGDGTLNCQDQCPLDSLKVGAGACGCGMIDIGRNGNGAPICSTLITASAVPSLASATIRREAVSLNLGVYSGNELQYIVTLKRGRSLKRYVSSKPSFRIKNLSKGRWLVSYSVRGTVNGRRITTASSGWKRFSI